MSEESGPVDSRVQPAIESLNHAIDALNTIEDTRSAAEGAALRAAALVREEMAELDEANCSLRLRAEPFLRARTAAAEAINEARIAEATWHSANAAVATAKDALDETRKQKVREQRTWRAQAKRAYEDARRQAKEAKADARRAGRLAEDRAVKLGELGEGFERAGFHIPDALRAFAQYRERRLGLEQVLQLNEARLAALEQEKEVANEAIGEAMGDLEALNEELQSSKPDCEPDSEPDGEPSAECSAAGAPTASVCDDCSSTWREDSLWRPSGDFDAHRSDDEDSFAGSGWSEDEDDASET